MTDRILPSLESSRGPRFASAQGEDNHSACRCRTDEHIGPATRVFCALRMPATERFRECQL